jgi:hypothetical protein
MGIRIDAEHRGEQGLNVRAPAQKVTYRPGYFRCRQ